jgi:hypothetical protein
MVKLFIFNKGDLHVQGESSERRGKGVERLCSIPIFGRDSFGCAWREWTRHGELNDQLDDHSSSTFSPIYELES